jgi:hypothetical protein
MVQMRAVLWDGMPVGCGICEATIRETRAWLQSSKWSNLVKRNNPIKGWTEQAAARE